MNDLIDRQAAIDALAKHEKSKGHNYTLFVDIVSECAEIIRDLPSVQSERKKGKWLGEDDAPVAMENGCPVRSCYCSECREWLTASDEYYVRGNFCPNCGADMRGEQ